MLAEIWRRKKYNNYLDGPHRNNTIRSKQDGTLRQIRQAEQHKHWPEEDTMGSSDDDSEKEPEEAQQGQDIRSTPLPSRTYCRSDVQDQTNEMIPYTFNWMTFYQGHTPFLAKIATLRTVTKEEKKSIIKAVFSWLEIRDIEWVIDLVPKCYLKHNKELFSNAQETSPP